MFLDIGLPLTRRGNIESSTSGGGLSMTRALLIGAATLLLGFSPAWAAPGGAPAAGAAGGGHATSGTHAGARGKAGSSYRTSGYYYSSRDVDPRLRKQGYRGYGYGYGASGAAGADPTKKPKRSLNLDKGHPKGYTDHIQQR
jgi:hypothetical protein